MPSAETGVVGRRCAQWLIDRLIAFVPPFALLIVMMFAVAPYRSLWYVPGAVFIVLLLLGNLATDVWMPHRTGGRTPGMRLLGLRIVTEWGGTPKLGAYLLRVLLQSVDGFAFGLAGLLVMVFSPRHQRVGDLVARTLVVRSVPAALDHPGDSLHHHGDAAQQQDALEH
ncbi:RDD family protein [Kutzneria sp. CA-103260]|uniref:RDD family protein n=1 Tax=Kutzneria sp. CA-103260 TaxID=2802641 RepID=UPI001BA8ED6C|nr:RDD family protein [Kutzneria sp. CA-103260]